MDLRALGKDLPYDLAVFGISGLSLVHGENRFSASELKRQVYRAFDLDASYRFAGVLTCIGTNDVKNISQMAEKMNLAEAYPEFEKGIPEKLKDLFDQEVDAHHELARSFGCSVFWINCGVAMNVSGREDRGEIPFFRRDVREPDGNRRGPTIRFNEFLSAFVSHHLYKSDGKLVNVAGPNGPEKFGIFATCPGVASLTGTGHPAVKRLGNWFSNILNCAGIVLCKILNSDLACNKFISKSGVPPYWDKKPFVLYEQKCQVARSRGLPLPEPVAYVTPTKHIQVEYYSTDSCKAVSKIALTKQHDWTQVCVSDDFEHNVVNKDSQVLYHDPHNPQLFLPGQVCRMKLGFKDRRDERYEAGLILMVTEKSQYVVSSLWNNQISLVPRDRVAVFKHMRIFKEWDWLKLSQI